MIGQTATASEKGWAVNRPEGHAAMKRGKRLEKMDHKDEVQQREV